MTVAEQRDLIAGSFRTLDPVRQFIFVLLLVERLLTICREVFPDGLPTRAVPYEDVMSAMDTLWGRIDTLDEVATIQVTSKAWRPLTSTGHVQHRPGAAIGFHISELMSILAATELHRPIDKILDVAWEAAQTLLFRLPENPDYSQSLIHTELDPELNHALLLEYRVQRDALSVLHGTGLMDVAVLRDESQRAGQAIANREREFLARS